MIIIDNKLIAEEGKLLRRKVAFPLTASTITLGKVLINGKMVDDVPENYEEIDIPSKEDRKNMFNMFRKKEETAEPVIEEAPIEESVEQPIEEPIAE